MICCFEHLVIVIADAILKLSNHVSLLQFKLKFKNETQATETQDLKNFAKFSDSLSVLTSFKNSFSESRPTLLQETIQTFNANKQSSFDLDP